MWKWKLWMSLLLGLQALCLIGGLLLISLALCHVEGWLSLPAMLCLLCVLPFALYSIRHSSGRKMGGVAILGGLILTMLPLITVLFAHSSWRLVGLLGYAVMWCEGLLYRAEMRSLRAVRKLRAEPSTST